MLKLEGPLLVAANHPNSFLDAIILATLFKNPIYSLARSDAFANKLFTTMLRSFNMMPVYRVSEGVENLESNYDTFQACQEIFTQNGIVLIFSEGRCINEWHLRPLKKGTARLALDAWKRGIDLKVLPVGINYSSFKNFGKTVILNFGKVIAAEELNNQLYSGKEINTFNERLLSELEKLVFEIDKNDIEKRKQLFFKGEPFLKKLILFLPAVLGFISHLPLFAMIHFSIRRIAKDHYDSVMIGLFFFIYPFYLLLLSLLLFSLTGSGFAFLSLPALPFFLWSYVQLKSRLTRNHLAFAESAFSMEF